MDKPREEPFWFAWKEPDERVVALAGQMKKRGMKRVLDLGCGAGRHVVYLAKEGFEVYGTDISMDALERTAQWLAEEGLSATLKRVDMTVIPYPDGFFDAVISLYVLHHNTIANIRTALSEIRRTLRPGGLFFATLVATGDFKEGRGQLIEPRTWVVEEQGYEDGVPHHFFTEDEIRAVLEGFRLIELERGERSFVEEATGHLVLSAHWEVWAERRKGDKNHLHGHATIRRARS